MSYSGGKAMSRKSMILLGCVLLMVLGIAGAGYYWHSNSGRLGYYFRLGQSLDSVKASPYFQELRCKVEGSGNDMGVFCVNNDAHLAIGAHFFEDRIAKINVRWDSHADRIKTAESEYRKAVSKLGENYEIKDFPNDTSKLLVFPDDAALCKKLGCKMILDEQGAGRDVAALVYVDGKDMRLPVHLVFEDTDAVKEARASHR
jgi:hypothetical protein